MENLKMCTGKVYKCYDTSYVDSNGGYVQKTTFKELKRLSCNCMRCEIEKETLDEYISFNTFPIVNEIVDGGLYTLKINTYQGYYDLYPEVEDIEFVLKPE
jgi:hypothetical protein